MDFRTFTTRQALATLGVCFGLLVLASPAAARPDLQSQPQSEESDAFTRYLANHHAHEARVSAATWGDQSAAFQRYLANLRAENQAYKATRTGIPDSVVAMIEKNAVVAEPTVIPYLSHGIGVEGGGSPAHLRQQPDGFQPQLHGVDSAPVAHDGFDWETTGYIGGAILAAMLLALMSTIALKDRRGPRSA